MDGLTQRSSAGLAGMLSYPTRGKLTHTVAQGFPVVRNLEQKLQLSLNSRLITHATSLLPNSVGQSQFQDWLRVEERELDSAS